MKPVFSTLLAASLALFTPQLAEACTVTKQLTQLDIAFADVIFEGSLTEVKEVPADRTAGGHDFFELTFDVKNVVRGKLQQDEIVIGWIYGGYRTPSEWSLESFKKDIGETTRVAVSTPELASLFCELKSRGGNFYDEDTGTYAFGESMQPVCDSTVNSLKPAFKENIPFVLSNGYVCGSLYLFPMQMYEDMRSYDVNYEAYKKARDKAQKEARANREKREAFNSVELYREMVPQSELSWKVPNPTARRSAVNLAIYHDVFFTQELKTNAAWLESFSDFGIVIARDEHGRRRAWFDRDETGLVKFQEDLKEEILRLLDYMEKDSNFRARLLLED